MKTILLVTTAALALPFSACDKKDNEDRAKEKLSEAKETAKDVKNDLKDKSSDTKLKIKGDWNQAKGKLKQKYAELTDDDLLYEEGKEDELIGRVQKRLGKSREEARKIIEGD
jgi:uncharacterized protein YjbJ (UPF0337 family)